MKNLLFLLAITLSIGSVSCRKQGSTTTTPGSPNDSFPPNRCRIISDGTYKYSYDSQGRVSTIISIFPSDTVTYTYYGTNLLVRINANKTFDTIIINSFGLMQQKRNYTPAGILNTNDSLIYDASGHLTKWYYSEPNVTYPFYDTTYISWTGEMPSQTNGNFAKRIPSFDLTKAYAIGDLFWITSISRYGVPVINQKFLSNDYLEPYADDYKCQYNFDVGGKITIADGLKIIPNTSQYGVAEHKVYTYECK